MRLMGNQGGFCSFPAAHRVVSFCQSSAEELLQILQESVLLPAALSFPLPAVPLSWAELDVLYELACSTIRDRYLTDERIVEFAMRAYLSSKNSGGIDEAARLSEIQS